MTGPCFIDTGFVIALVSRRDRYHAIAKHLSDQIEADGTRLVTSQAIILEIGAALSKSVFRSAAIRLIEAMQSDPLIEVVPASDERLQHALAAVLLKLLNGKSLRRPVFMNVIVFNYEDSPGKPSPRRMEDVKSGVLEAEVVEGFNTRYGKLVSKFRDLVVQ